MENIKSIICCHVVTENTDENSLLEKFIFLLIGSAFTLLGSYLITRYQNSFTNRRNLEITKSDIIANCHKLLRTYTGMQSAALNFKVSDRLSLIVQSEIAKKGHKEQTLIFQKYYIDYKFLTESYRSELQKHILLYLTYCDISTGEKMWELKKIIDGNETIKSYEEYDNLNTEQGVKKQEEIDRLKSADDFYKSQTGKALNDIMNLLARDVMTIYSKNN